MRLLNKELDEQVQALAQKYDNLPNWMKVGNESPAPEFAESPNPAAAEPRD